ncbi:MAG: ABC transporter substrate-binding protein [Hyphomicrobiales bacterium]|nr:ABC transporter substrate-binding protein [Hyphomicrobiales bacterium]
MISKLAKMIGLAGLILAAAIPAKADTSITVQAGSSNPSAVYMPVYIAQKVGFFKKEGLDVTLRYGNGGPLAAQLVSSGDADVAHIVFTPVILGHGNGLKGKFFYQTYTHMMYFLAVPEDSKIKTAADLKGTKIGVFNMGSAAVYVTKSTAKAAGVDPSTMQFIPVGAGTQALAALQSGQVDALGLWDAVYATYEAAGTHLRYIYHPTLKNVGNGGFFASAQALANKADALKGFSRAISEATEFLKANPEAAAKIYWEVNPAAKQGDDEAQALKRTEIEMHFVAEAFDVQNRPDHQYGELSDKDVQANIDILKEAGLLKSEVAPDDIVTRDFVPAANDFDRKKIDDFAKSWKMD